MRHCSECGSEFQDWVDVCVDCGAGLKDGPPTVQPLQDTPEPAGEELHFSGNFATVASFGTEIEANLYQSILESEGIQSYVFVEQLIYGSENCSGIIRLRVKAPDAEKALVIIKEIIAENAEAAESGKQPVDEAVEASEDLVEPEENEKEDVSTNSEEEEVIRCPLCSSSDIYESGQGILRAFRRSKWKCADCSHTFSL